MSRRPQSPDLVVESQFLRADEVATILGVSEAHARNLMRSGEIPSTYIGRKALRASKEGFRRYLEGRHQDAATRSATYDHERVRTLITRAARRA